MTTKKKNNIGAFGHPIYRKGFAKYGEEHETGCSEKMNALDKNAPRYPLSVVYDLLASTPQPPVILQKNSEKPINHEGLQEEIARTYHDGSVADTSDIDHVSYENIAEYFYELGCRRTAEKYDEIEYNRQREEGRVLPGFEDEPKGIPGKDFVPVEWVETLERYGKWKIVKLEDDGSSEIPKDLEEAAEKYVSTLCDRADEGLRIDTTLESAFKAGAKWQKEQMMKEAVEISYKGGIARINGEEKPFDGGVVRVIILPKED